MDEQHQPSNGDRMDRFERGLDHLLEMQAKHDARLARHESAADARFENLTEALTRLVGVVDRLAVVQSEASRETAERFRETDERFNALIKIVDELVRKRPPEPPPAYA